MENNDFLGTVSWPDCGAMIVKKGPAAENSCRLKCCGTAKTKV
jgi:hypothetical protein